MGKKYSKKIYKEIIISSQFTFMLNLTLKVWQISDVENEHSKAGFLKIGELLGGRS